MITVGGIVHALGRMVRRFFSRPIGLAEMISGVATIIWGWVMVKTDPLSTWHSLDYLLKWWDSDAWGWLDMCLGTSQLCAFGMFDEHWRRSLWRLLAAFVLCVLWGMNTISVFAAPTPPPPWIGPIAAMWFLNFYLIVRISLVRSGGHV